MKNEIMRVNETFETLNEMAKRLGEITMEYTERVFSIPGNYTQEADFGYENRNGELIWYIKWQAWKCE